MKTRTDSPTTRRTRSATDVGRDPSPIETRTVRTVFGELRLVADPQHLLRVSWADATNARATVGTGPHPLLDRAVAEILEYAAGDRRKFDVPLSFEGVAGPFHRRVLEVLQRDVGFGCTLTYGELAALAGRPGAARAVGSAMSHNPLPIFVPCHRVLASHGIGGFGPGLDVKRRLLRHEGVHEA